MNEPPECCYDEDAAFEFLENHKWGEAPVCSKCDGADVYQMKSMDGYREKNYRWRCRGCHHQFTVRVNTVFEESRLPLRYWCLIFWMTCNGGVTAAKISKWTEISYKSAIRAVKVVRYVLN